MNWTKETPKETGWYWCAIDREFWPRLPAELYRPNLFMVYGRPDEKRVADTVNNEDYAVAEMTGRYWSGPIAEPEPPATN